MGITFEGVKREMSQNAPGGAPPNRISEEVFVSCAGHPSHVEMGEGRGEEEKGKEKGIHIYRITISRFGCNTIAQSG